MYLSCDMKKFHDNESTHIFHNYWMSTQSLTSPPPSSGGATVYGRRQIIVLYSPGGTDVFVYLSTVFCAYRNLPLRLQIVRFCSF